MSCHLQLYCLQVIYFDEERKYNKDITLGLIHSELLNLVEYSVHIAKLIDGEAATEFAISLLQTLVVDESSVISELHNFVDELAKVAAKPGSFKPLQHLVEIIKNPATSIYQRLRLGKRIRLDLPKTRRFL
ncbi:CCR4-NOT transcription complex subunit 1 isoform X1 [Cucumis melo var. makuwa]|uniref:CCR4-NOT transcription complex subunit 1 isoform X1 n=2 Tax=Cucumis melo TaxID=3656 RepID=A0A5D3BZF9_CUCMM|nr:CCR4-NOT transcription complex subunit 1 isoform X1 [Cucumis melo var. makuwa]